MKSTHQQVTIFIEAALAPFAITALDTLEIFDGYKEEEDYLIAYVPIEHWSEDIKKKIAELLSIATDQVKAEGLPYQNYNELWESQFQPVIIEGCVTVLADFHNNLNVETPHVIKIAPKMAFGTGHHATTAMMLGAMCELEFTDKTVLDYGAGTGILSVMAGLLGASHVVANDIQAEAKDNIIEHITMNPTKTSYTVLHGNLSTVPKQQYDIILANINVPVLLDSAESLYDLLSDQGIILLSGILVERREEVENIYKKTGMLFASVTKKGEWTCLKMTKD